MGEYDINKIKESDVLKGYILYNTDAEKHGVWMAD